jgi:hypothetical protein
MFGLTKKDSGMVVADSPVFSLINKDSSKSLPGLHSTFLV